MNDERKSYKRPQMREINIESESIVAASPGGDAGGRTDPFGGDPGDD